MISVYDADGQRESFDPVRAGAHLAGCVLCGQRIKVVVLFIPQSEVMRAAVLRLRVHPVPDRSTSGLTYGLCARHGAVDPDEVIAEVESAILAASKRVNVQ